ncbi:hypothetical protein [Tepidicella baoligensis]|nr:hypothetical protein [Tepidicella baoligensis]
MAEHLRDATRKLKLFAKMNRALSRELSPPAAPDGGSSSFGDPANP